MELKIPILHYWIHNIIRIIGPFFSVFFCDIRIVNIAIPDEYVEHGNVELLRKEVGLDADTIIARTIEAYQNVTE